VSFHYAIIIRYPQNPTRRYDATVGFLNATREMIRIRSFEIEGALTDQAEGRGQRAEGRGNAQRPRSKGRDLNRRKQTFLRNFVCFAGVC
jgi:hypothetical protein